MEYQRHTNIYKGRTKDTEESQKVNDLTTTDSQLWLMHKKVEKMTMAIYMITDFFNDNEPLKWDLRKQSIVFLSLMTLSAGTHHVSNKGQILAQLMSTISGILPLLELALHANLISPINYSILKDEYLALSSKIRSRSEGISVADSFVFPDNFFKEDALGESGELNKIREPTFPGHKRHDKRHFKNHQHKSGDSGGYFRNHALKIRGNERSPTNTQNYLTEPKQEKKSMRQESILRLLEAKGELTIKDMLSVISDCSGKTIQRELVSLIEKRVVQKIGERRWSRYALNSVSR